MIDKHLKFLSQKNLETRRENLCEVLSSEGVNFRTMGNPEDCINYIFSTKTNETGGYLFSAHYDNVSGSFGANDNMAAVCILIDLYRALNDRNIRAGFVFFDGEERGYSGSKLYVESGETKNFDGAVNLDVCGYGDSIVIFGKHKNIFGRFTAREILKEHNAQVVKYLPESDDVILRKKLPSLGISILPKWDVQYLKALASFGDRPLGMPPEFGMIVSQMEISQTMHGGEKDSPEFVQAEAMQKVHDFLFDAMTKNYAREKFSLKKFWAGLFANN